MQPPETETAAPAGTGDGGENISRGRDEAENTASLGPLQLSLLQQTHLDWLTSRGVDVLSVVSPTPVRLAHGRVAADGCFEPEPNGPGWLVFQEPGDWVFWQPRTREMATWLGRSFALSEELIFEAVTYAINGRLRIFASPLDWLKANRNGIVVIDWRRAFERLRDAPRLAVDEALMPLYWRHMKPPRLPQVQIVRHEGRTAA
jgi:hypothetical protein